MRSLAKFSVSSWTGFFIGVVAVSVTTRVFTPDIVGRLNMFNSAVDIFVSIVLVGMGSVVNRFFYELPKGWTLQEMFTRCLVITLIVLLISSMVIFSRFMDDAFISILANDSILIRVLFIINSLSVMVLTYFLSQFYRYSNDAYHFTIQQILMQFFSKLFVVVAALVKPTLEVVIAFNTVGVFFLMITYVFVQRKSLFSWKKGGWYSPEFKPLYRFAFFSWPNEIVQKLATFLLPYFITMLLGAEELGLYASAGFFVTAFGVLQGGFRTYWAAFMYRYYRTEIDKICKIHSYVGIALISIMGLYIIFQHVLYMLIGESFHGSRLFFTLVLLPPMLGLWEQTTYYGISLAKKNEQKMTISIITVLLNVCCTYFCILKWGLLGAAIGMSMTAVARFILMSWRGQCYYKSIHSKTETFGGLLLLLGLTISNVVFNNQYFYEIILVFLVLFITAIFYRRSLCEILQIIRR